MSDPIKASIREAARQKAISDLQPYITRRWTELGPQVATAMAATWLRFREMNEDQQLGVFIALYQRSTVLSMDRANQIADAQVSAVEPSKSVAA